MQPPLQQPDARPGIRAELSLFALASIALLVNAWLLAEIAAYSENSLLRHPKWISSKPLQQMASFMSYEFVWTRRALHRNQLDLGVWQGFQEISFDRIFELGKIELDLNLGWDTYLDTIFNRDANGYDGVRLSWGSITKSYAFRSDRAGRFLSLTPLEVAIYPGWHKLAIAFEGGVFVVRVDGKEIAKLDYPRKPRQFVSLRGGPRSTVVDDVSITDSSGAVVASEDFSNRRGLWRRFERFARLLGATLLLPLALLRILAHWLPRTRGTLSLSAFMIQMIVGSCAAEYLAFDYYFWSGRYSYSGWLSGHFESLREEFLGDIDAKRHSYERYYYLNLRSTEIVRAITRWDRQQDLELSSTHLILFSPDEPTGRQIQRDLPLPTKPQGALRIGFIGTSFTFGEGADLLRATFVARTFRLLSERMPPGQRLEIANLAIQGKSAWELVAHLHGRKDSAELDLAVIVLGSNDRDPAAFQAGLRAMMKHFMDRGVPVVLIPEPEAQPELEHLERNHAIIKKLAAEFGAPLLDLHPHLEENFESGTLWWDVVHMSSLGHALAAEWLTPRLWEIAQRLLQAPSRIADSAGSGAQPFVE